MNTLFRPRHMTAYNPAALTAPAPVQAEEISPAGISLLPPPRTSILRTVGDWIFDAVLLMGYALTVIMCFLA